MKKIKELFFNKKAIIVGGIVSFLFSYSFFFGFLCHSEQNSFKPYMPAVFFLMWAGFFFLINSAWHFLDLLFVKTEKKKKSENENTFPAKKLTALFFVSFAAIIIAWIPCWLISYPGFFVYDSGKEFVQIWYDDIPVWGRIPIIHSCILRFLCKVGMKISGSFNAGIAMFSWVHMILGAIAFSYETIFLLRYSRKTWIYIASLLYFMFSPVIVLFSGCSNSTIFGSALALLMILKFYEIFFDESFAKKSKKIKILNIIIFAAISILTCHARSSFTSIFCALILIQLIFGLIKGIAGKRIIINTVCLAALLAGAFMFNRGIIAVFDAETPPDAELLSVPLQQLANVYVKRGDEAFSKEDKEVLLNYYSEDHFQYFCYWCADPIKLGLNETEIDQNVGPFWKLCIKYGLKYPGDYLEAWNYLTYQAWYPLCEPDGYTRRNYIEAEYRSDFFKDNLEAPAEFVNLFPKAFEVVHWFSTEAYVHNIPFIGQISTIGYQYLILLFVLGFGICKKRGRFNALLCANLFYFVVMLFAPLVLIRYHLILFYLMPVTIGNLFVKE